MSCCRRAIAGAQDQAVTSRRLGAILEDHRVGRDVVDPWRRVSVPGAGNPVGVPGVGPSKNGGFPGKNGEKWGNHHGKMGIS